MSNDMRLCAVSWETACSDGCDPLSVGESGPIGCCGAAVSAATTAAATAAYVAPPSGETRCRLPKASCSSVALEVLAGGCTEPVSSAGRFAAGSEERPEAASPAGPRLPARWCSDQFKETDPSGLLFPTGTVGRLATLSAMALLNSLWRAGHNFISLASVGVIFNVAKATSFMLSIVLRGESRTKPKF